MTYRIRRSLSVAGMIAFVLVTMARVTETRAPGLESSSAQDAAPAPRTPWGEPDLQGLWAVDFLVPVERPARVTKEFYTEEEVAELDDLRTGTSLFGNHLRAEPGSEADVAGAYSSVFTSQRPTGRRTAMIIDPTGGKIPPLTPEAQETQAVMREYELALMQNTAACRDNLPGCRGGTYGPPSPRRAELPPYYSTRNVNRANGPEDRSLGSAV